MNFAVLLRPFIYVYYFVSYLITIPVLIIKFFGRGLFYLVKLIIKQTKLLVSFLFKSISLIFLYFGVGLKTLLIIIYQGFYKLIYLILLFFKYIIVGISHLIKKIYQFIIIIVMNFVRGLVFIGQQIFNGFRRFLNGIKNTIVKITIFIKKRLILPILAYPRKLVAGLKQYVMIKRENTKIWWRDVKKYFIRRYSNLTIVKQIRNRRDIHRKVLLVDFLEQDEERSEAKVTYKYLIKNTEGRIISGYFDAFSKMDVHSYLLTEGAEVYEIKTSRWIQLFHSGAVKNYRIKLKDLTFLLTQLSTYLKAGIPLVDAVKILSRQTKNRRLTKVLQAVVYELVMGDSFSEALEKQSAAFPRLLINMIKTAEMTGKLSEVLDDMAEYYDSAQKTRSQMVSAMLYPAGVLVMATGVIVFVMIYIVPQFVDMFRNMEADIPAITLIVINTSDFLRKNIFYLVGGLIIVIILLRLLYRTVRFFRYLVQWVLMNLPVIGKIIIYNEVTIFTKTFGSLLTHNVYITASMEILSKITDNEIYKFIIEDSITNVARGDVLSAAFKDNWAFPSVAYEMLVTGERTGELGSMMNRVGDYYQEQHRLAIAQVKNFIEPVMIVILSIIVGIILLSIVVPMFSMYEQF